MGIPDIRERWKAAGNSGIHLKGPYTDLLAPRHSFQALVEGLQLRGGTRDMEGETELYGYGMSVRGMVAIVPVLSPPLVQYSGRRHLFCV